MQGTAYTTTPSDLAGEPAMAVPQIRNAGPGYEWKAVALLSLAFGLVGLDRWIIAPLAPAIIADLGISPPLINALIAILGVTWGIAAVAMGSLSDRIGRRKVMLPAILIFSIASGLSGLAAGFTSLLLIRGFMGIAEGAFCPTSFASTAEASNPSRIGFNQGLQQSMFALFGLGFGPILATWLLGFTSWRGVFAIVMLPGVILTVLLWMVIREPDTITDKRQATTKASVSEVLKVRNVQISMVGLLCAMCGIFVLSANTPIYLASYLKLTPIQVGLVTSAIGFGGFVGQWVLPALSDIFGRRPMAVLGFVGGAAFVYLFMNIGAQPMQLFGALFAATVFSFGLLSLLTGPVAAESAPAGMVSTAAGLIIGVGEIFGGGLALLVAGYVIATYGIQYMLYLALGGLVFGAFLMLGLAETAPRKVKRNA
ncbi:putative MFS family arabinose efflux permease [Sphingomonas sp. PP-F2F-A104-K0414]|nr:putative MFS family arabinose efflux permease [Sphingomonas sp. PP-F2F-A104-K0414]